jgi:uncharacterized protein involved in exopolysaccharide biosynthesis
VKLESTLRSFIGVVSDNLKLLVLGTIVAGLIAFGLAGVWPKSYTSVAYLTIDENEAKTADARMRSTLVLDKVLAEFKVPEDTLEARRRHLEENRRIIVATGTSPKTPGLFRLEYSDRDPAAAQKINSSFIEAWLASTQPPPERRATLEAEIQRSDLQVQSISQLIDRLVKDAPSLIAPSSLQGELATPIASLIAKRDEGLANLTKLRDLLKGVSRDVIFAPPDLPEEPSWPKVGIITLLATFASALLLLVFVVLRRFLRNPA